MVLVTLVLPHVALSVSSQSCNSIEIAEDYEIVLQVIGLYDKSPVAGRADLCPGQWLLLSGHRRQ